MKTSLFISYLLVAFIAMVSCDPTSPAPAINYKIKELTILFNDDTANYSFSYDGTNLNSITRDGRNYANITYADNKAWVMMNYNFYKDTFLINYNGSKLVDSIKHFNGIDNRHFFRNVSNHLDSCRYTESGKSLFYSNFAESGGQPFTYDHSNVYTCGVFNTCYQTNKDTILYNTRINQANLPGQFLTMPLSEGISLLDLNPLFLVQQSSIFLYQPHANLISNLYTSYSILVSQSPPKRLHFRYEYSFDSKGRITLIYQYDDLLSTSIPFKTYALTYFD